MVRFLGNLFFISTFLAAGSAKLTTDITINNHTSEIIASEVTCLSSLDYDVLQNPEELPLKKCFHVQVPENYEDATSPKLNLYVEQEMISRDSQTERVFIPPGGGPGGSTTGEWSRESMFFGQDMILVDPRGVGYSTPFILCDGARLTDECLKEWKNKGHDLQAYNTLNNARDLEAIRLVFGYSEVNLYGFSYGAITSMMYMREYPKQLGVSFLNAVPFPGIEKSYSWGMQTVVAKRVLKRCRAQREGKSHYPCSWLRKPIRKFNRMLDRIRRLDDEKLLVVMTKLRDVLFSRKTQVSTLPLFIRTILKKDVEKKPLEDLRNLLDKFPKSHWTSLQEGLKSNVVEEGSDPPKSVNMTVHALMQLTDGWEDWSKYKFEYRPYARLQEDAAQPKQSSIKRQEWILGGDWKVDVPVVFIKGRYDAVSPMEGVDPWLSHFQQERVKVVEDRWSNHAGPFACVDHYMSEVFRDQEKVHQPPSCLSNAGEFVFPQRLSELRSNKTPDCVVPSKSYLERRWFWLLKYKKYSIGLKSTLTKAAFDNVWKLDAVKDAVENFRKKELCDSSISLEFTKALRDEIGGEW